jgi:hypothetical protein
MNLGLKEICWIIFCMKLVTVISLINYYRHFIALLVNSYNNILLPFLRQFFLVQNKSNLYLQYTAAIWQASDLHFQRNVTSSAYRN